MTAFNKQGIEEFIRNGEKSPPPVFVGRKSVMRDIEDTADDGSGRSAGGKAGGMTARGRQGLEQFLNNTEGEPPPVFVGRELAFRDIEDAADRGIPGKTRIIHGAPGAGKSSILAELRSRSAETDKQTRRPRVITLSSTDLFDNLPGIFAEIGAVAAASDAGWRTIASNPAEQRRAVWAFAESAGFDRDSPGPPHRLEDLKRKLPPERWDSPVIVAFDESQRLTEDKGSPHAIFLRGIHDASEQLPLTLVLAGLGDTPDVARGCGLTGDVILHSIRGLEANDVTSLLFGFCERFGLDSAGCEERLEQFAYPCEGWPCQLHYALQELSREALKTDGFLRRIDWQQAESRAAERRTRLFHGQYSQDMGKANRLTEAVVRDFEPGMRESDVLRLIKGTVRDKVGWCPPGEMSAAGFLRHLIHMGVLQRADDGSLVSPMPAFHAFLIAKAVWRGGRLSPSTGGITSRPR